MANVATRCTALLITITGALAAQSAPDQQAACIRTRDLAKAGGFAAVAAAGTAGQKIGARRATAWTIAATPSASAEWNDSQTPAHIFASYELAKVGASAFGRCASPVGAAWRGVAYSAAIGVAKEVADGFYDGFNAADLVADGTGLGLALAQAYLPRLASTTLTISTTGLKPVHTVHGQRFGGPGHAMWLSLKPHDILPAALGSKWPSPLRVSIGRRAPSTLNGAPEYAATLDLDASELIGKSGRLRGLTSALRSVHLPAPGVIVGSGQRARFALVW